VRQQPRVGADDVGGCAGLGPASRRDGFRWHGGGRDTADRAQSDLDHADHDHANRDDADLQHHHLDLHCDYADRDDADLHHHVDYADRDDADLHHHHVDYAGHDDAELHHHHAFAGRAAFGAGLAGPGRSRRCRRADDVAYARRPWLLPARAHRER
jgi:hypothetical protein